MGYIAHHTIVVTSCIKGSINIAHREAVKIFGTGVSGIVGPLVNATESFFIAPDGSKEGWEQGDIGDTCRDNFIEWLEIDAVEHGLWLDWIEVKFGGDEPDLLYIARHSS